jgi:D-inositol-3-phosphate glycosyltransferase
MTDRPVWMFSNNIGRDVTPASQTIIQRSKQLLQEYRERFNAEYGASVAEGTFSGAMLRYQSRNLTIVTSAEMKERIVKTFSPALNGGSRISPITVSELPSELAQSGCKAWIDATGYPVPPFTLRSLFAQQHYPILFTHHSISYPHYIYEIFLPLILSTTFPFDTFVCSSQAASRQAYNLLHRISEDLASKLNVRRQFNGTLEVIPFGIDTNIFYPRDRIKMRKRLGLDRDAFTVIYVGRVSPVDKADLIPFLRVVKELANRIFPKRLKVLIAGGSHHGYENIIKEYIAQARLQSIVKLLYRIPTYELADFYCAADVFIALSDNIQECFGLSAIEAMACGVPQIVPDWSGYKDTIEEGITGFRIPTYWTPCDDDINPLASIFPKMWSWNHFTLAQSVAIDLEILLNRLTVLGTNPSTLQAMGVASVNRARTLYDWKVVIQAYENLIDNRVRESDTYPVSKDHPYPFGFPGLFTTTSHFASKLVSDNTPLKPSLLHGKHAPQESEKYIEHFRTFQKTFLNNPTQVIAKCDSAGNFGDYRRCITQQLGCTNTEASRHVMWLIKYGYLSIN